VVSAGTHLSEGDIGQTVVEKVTQSHLAAGPPRLLRAGDFVSVRPRHVLTHDNTAPVMAKFLGIGGRRIEDARQPVFVIDHDIQNRSEENLAKYRAIEQFARDQGVDFYPAGSGIGHQVMVEQQYVVPGSFVVASDSHANMYGALGAVGTPVVRTDAAAIWACGEFWWQIPPTVRVRLEGGLPTGATGKDVIIALCGRYHRGEVGNAAVEFGGPGVAALSIEERLAIANMTTEWGALVGWFPIDATTLAYLASRRKKLAERGVSRVTDDQLTEWAQRPIGPDADAVYAGTVTLDLSTVEPHVSGPNSVHLATPLGELVPRRIAVDKAYLVSCVNSRAADIAAAAAVLRGRKIAPGVELYVAAASREEQEAAEAAGDWHALLEAGAKPLPPGCGPCIGLGAGLLEAGEVGISATNRNFKGRMGSPDAECYLASPAVVAASALAGRIDGPAAIAAGAAGVEYRFEASAAIEPLDEPSPLVPGFPERLRGRLVFLPHDDLNTDAIYGGEYTYRDGMTPEEMARVVFANHDPGLAERLRPGDVIVGARNFGTGSSREQAATSLQAAGVRLVIAADYSRTFLRNAFNNGLPCIGCAGLVDLLAEAFGDEIASGARFLIPGDEVDVDFVGSTITYRSDRLRFTPIGAVPQELVVCGGIEGKLRRELGS
jgi:homoaconitate hydratase